MVHQRINERESNPNPHINFITALKDYGSSSGSKDDAHQYLCALAAQVRPVMKAHGFAVNTLVEYEYNQVFAGRNWNNGETIELVLRREDGSFLPSSWLMSTLCHELAHIKHMNHGQAFQSLWKCLRDEVRILQFQGYFGDGFWSSGTRLADSSKITGKGIDVGGLPEFMCGGAQTRSRPTATRRRRTHNPRPLDTTIVASTKSGRQTAKKRKAGARVTSKYAFAGEGVPLGNDQSEGKGKGKQATSKRAREERAAAIERRVLAMQAATLSQPAGGGVGSHGEGDSSDEEELIAETNSDRRKTLISARHADDVDGLDAGTSWLAFEDDFNFISGSSTIGTSPTPGTSNHMEGKLRPTPANSSTSLGVGKLVHNEINLRKKESLGMAPIKGRGRTVGGVEPIAGTSSPSRSRLILPIEEPKLGQLRWSCLVCTLDNEVQHLACSACATPRRGQTSTERV